MVVVPRADVHTKCHSPGIDIVKCKDSWLKGIPYSRKYWRGQYLADWQILVTLPILRQPHRLRRGDRTETAKFISANCNFLPFSSNPPNIIPANISGYTVVTGCHRTSVFVVPSADLLETFSTIEMSSEPTLCLLITCAYTLKVGTSKDHYICTKIFRKTVWLYD